MVLIGGLYGITSERRLSEEVLFNLAYRWFCRLPLDVSVPHHSTFSKNRHGRFRDAGIFRVLIEQTVQRCADAGLIARKDAAIDASFVAADASWQRKLRDADIAASRLPPTGSGMDSRSGECTAPGAWCAARQAGGGITDRSRIGVVGAHRTRAFRLCLQYIDRHSGGRDNRRGGQPRALCGRGRCGTGDAGAGGRSFRLSTQTRRGQPAYGSAAVLAFVNDRGTVPHIPVMERSEQTKGKFAREAFRYEREEKRYVCPAGKPLPFRDADRKAGLLRYRASPADCRACHLKRKCTVSTSRSVTHSEFEDVRELVRGGMQTPLFKRSMRLRRGVERLFADAKGKRGLARLHLRGAEKHSKRGHYLDMDSRLTGTALILR